LNKEILKINVSNNMETNTTTNAITKWIMDPVHSELEFRVKHMMITNVKGEFKKFRAEIEGPDFLTSPIKVIIDAASLSTNDNSRDVHLRSADFFDIENHKEILFVAVSMNKTSEQLYKLKGLLTIKGVSREIVLDVEHGGSSKDPWGNEKTGFSLTGKISRKDWGLNWNAALETGGVLVSDEVRINAEVQFIKQPVV
jgi:polyisoprenoid-binding protein YceI